MRIPKALAAFGLALFIWCVVSYEFLMAYPLTLVAMVLIILVGL